VVGLLMPNRPEYLAIWLGITRVGGVVALLNTNLAGQSLAHCMRAASAKHLIVAAELADALDTALPHLAAPPQAWIHGGRGGIDEEIEGLVAAPLQARELREITIDDRALYIFTSGTTGMPKAAKVSHARVMQWALWFAAMMVVFFHAARLALVVFDPYLSSRPLAEALLAAPPGRLIVDDQYYTFSSVFFYTNRRALLLNGQVNNLVYWSYAPDAPKDVFIGDEDFRRLWTGAERFYLVVEGPKVKRLQGLTTANRFHLILASGGKYLFTNN